MSKKRSFFDRGQIFVGNDRFVRGKLTIFWEALRFLVRWGSGWSSDYLFSYRIAMVGGTLYLVGSGVHEHELRVRIGGEIHWFDARRFYRLSSMIAAKFRTLIDAPVAIAVLWKRGEPGQIFNFLYNVFNYHVCLAYLAEMERQLKPSGYGTFELRYIGVAVSEFCEENAKKSVFVQHGLFDQALCAIRFDEYFIWSDWDKDFFDDADGTFHLKFPKIAGPKRSNIGASKIMYFALEIQGPTLRRGFILNKVGELMESAKKMGWSVILRPHPRDTSNIASAIIERAGGFGQIDPYANLPIVDSFKRNHGAIYVTFNSASIFDIQNEGIFCVTIKNPLQDFVLIPFSRISLQLESARELEKFLGADSATS